MNQGELFTAFLVDLQRIFRTEVVPKNLSYSQVLAIIIIPDDGIEMSELARTLGLENSTVTRLIARLERNNCLLYTSPSPRDGLLSRMPSSA